MSEPTSSNSKSLVSEGERPKKNSCQSTAERPVTVSRNMATAIFRLWRVRQDGNPSRPRRWHSLHHQDAAEEHHQASEPRRLAQSWRHTNLTRMGAPGGPTPLDRRAVSSAAGTLRPGPAAR